MNIQRLHEIISQTTVIFRKGEVFSGTPALVAAAKRGDALKGAGTLVIDAMPHEDEAPNELERVDLCLVTIGVDKTAAAKFKDELVALLDPEACRELRLAEGPSYIAVGAVLDDQAAAFRLFALGKVLALWDLITPATFGAEGEQARELASAGYVMIGGYWRAGAHR